MSGLQFQIPPSLLAGMYKDTLIGSNEPAAPLEKNTAAPAQAANTPVQGPVAPPQAANTVAEPAGSYAPAANTAPKAPVAPTQASRPSVALPDTPPEKWFLGGNAKGIVVIVNDMENVYLSDDELQLLTGILNACKLNMQDIAVVNYARYPYPFNRLQQLMQVNNCILFEVSLQQVQLPFSIPYNQVQAFNNCTFTYAPSLRTMLGSTEEAKLQKSKLWLSLKKMFNI